MTPEQIEAIRARERAATPGPFKLDYDHEEKCWIIEQVDDEGGIVAQVFACHDFQPLQDQCGTSESNARFFCEARTDIPALLSHIDTQAARIAELDGENKRIRKALTGAIVNYDTCPYQMATEEIERLEQTPVKVTVNGKADFWYLLDAQAVDDIAGRVCPYEADAWVRIAELEAEVERLRQYADQTVRGKEI